MSWSWTNGPVIIPIAIVFLVGFRIYPQAAVIAPTIHLILIVPKATSGMAAVDFFPITVAFLLGVGYLPKSTLAAPIIYLIDPQGGLTRLVPEMPSPLIPSINTFSAARSQYQQPTPVRLVQADLDPYGGYSPQYSGMAIPVAPMNGKSTGSVINSGTALEGNLAATGKTNTQTGRLGAMTSGHGGMGGSGVGIQATSVNSANANSGGMSSLAGISNLPPWLMQGGGGALLGPSSGAANAMFVNSLVADKGTVLGSSDTISRTGMNGNAYGSASGNAMGQGKGIQLTQIANSDSEGSGFSDPFGPFGPYGHSRHR